MERRVIRGVVGRLAAVFAIILLTTAAEGQARGWTQTGTGPVGAVSVAVDPADPRRLFAADLEGTTLYASRDGGAKWVASPMNGFSVGGFSSVEGALAVGAGGDGPLYAAGQETVAPNATHPGDHGIWRSDDDGETWQHIFDAGECVGGPYSCATPSVAASPDLPGVIYAAVENSAVFSVWVDFIGSVDAGHTWRRITPGDQPGPLDGEGTLGVGPGGALYVSTGYRYVGGAPPARSFRSVSEGGAWEPIQSPTDRPALSLAVDAGDPSVVFWASFGRLYDSVDGGENWSPTPLVVGTDGLFGVNADLTTPNVEYFWSGAQVWRSEDRGSTWQPLPRLEAPILVIAAAGGQLYAATQRGVSAFHQVQVLPLPPATADKVHR